MLNSLDKFGVEGWVFNYGEFIHKVVNKIPTKKMKFVIQRVSHAAVSVRKEPVAFIENGFLILVGIGRGDTKETAEWMIQKH